MAVGISCAATGMRAALDLLAPRLTDAVDFVRQGALIANALVLMQQPESKVSCPVFCALSGISNGYIYHMSGSTFSASASPWGMNGGCCCLRLHCVMAEAHVLLSLPVKIRSTALWTSLEACRT